MRLLIVMIALIAMAGAATAQEPPRALIGTWEMSNAERDRSCQLTLKNTPAGPGFALEWDKRCLEIFPFPREVIAWKIGAREAIALINARGQSVLELTEVEGGLYEGERPGQGLVFLQSVASTAAEQRKPEELIGDWAFARAEGPPLCHITLMNTPGTRETYALRVKPGCDEGIARLGLNSWRIDRTQLLIAPQRGDSWRFEDTDGRWRRIPTRPDSLLLTRP
jgi:hypothetical protein